MLYYGLAFAFSGGTNTYNLHTLSASTIETVYCLKERGVRDLPAQHGPYLVAVSVNCLSQIPTASASKIGNTFQI